MSHPLDRRVSDLSPRGSITVPCVRGHLTPFHIERPITGHTDRNYSDAPHLASQLIRFAQKTLRVLGQRSDLSAPYANRQHRKMRYCLFGGDKRDRTADLLNAIV